MSTGAEQGVKMNLTTATPVEIDTELGRLYGEIQSAQARIARSMGDIHRYAGDNGRWVNASRKAFDLTDEQAEVKAREFAATGTYSAEPAQRVLAGIDQARADIAAAKAAARPLDAEYDSRGGWTRFFLVTSSNGHIHSSMECSTCNPRTGYGWMPDQSGQTMTEAIAQWDERGSAEVLCTVCFPDAPSARTEKPVDADQCPGSGTLDYPRETARLGFYSGNYGVCSHCSQPITVSKLGRMRKHKKA